MFNPNNLDEGKGMVVGDCNDIPTEKRWKVETPIFKEIIFKQMGNAKVIVDYGCGVGRLAREIIDNNKDIEKVIGIDSSRKMLEVAKQYVLSERFIPVHTSEINSIKYKVDYLYCIYVLQHVPAIELREVINDLATLSNRVFVVNSCVRMAVSGEGFVNDGIDILKELSRKFKTIRWGIPIRYIIDNEIMRTMFLDGNTKHYGVLCENEK